MLNRKNYISAPRFTYIALGGLFALLLLCLAIFSQGIWDTIQILTGMARDIIQPLGFAGYFAYIAMAAIAMCMFVPRQALSFIGGALFGGLTGAVLAILACVLACGLATTLGRCMGRLWLKKHAPKPLTYLDTILTDKPILAAISLRLLPTGNNLIFSYLGGVSTAPAWAFVLGSGIGYIPQNVLFALLGSGIMLEDEMLTITFITTAIALAIAYYIYAGMRTRSRMN